MLAAKVFPSGLNPISTAAICTDVVYGITATGTNQTTAYAIKNASVEFATVAAGTGAVLPVFGVNGDTVWIYNAGSHPLTLYPPSGGNINGQASNGGVQIGTNTTCVFRKISPTRWAGLLSA